MKPQILLRKTLKKTKIFLHKTIKNLKSFLFGGYEKLPKPPYVNPFFNVSNSCQTMQELDDFYRCFSEQWESNDHDVSKKIKNKGTIQQKAQTIEDGESNQSQSNTTDKMINVENSQKERRTTAKKKLKGKREELSTDAANESSHSLMNFTQKMKQFEMLDIDDVDHLLDIEEVLHYYSRLRCPVFQELVDKFCMDMYSEFLPQQPSVSVNSSMQRLAPLKL